MGFGDTAAAMAAILLEVGNKINVELLYLRVHDTYVMNDIEGDTWLNIKGLNSLRTTQCKPQNKDLARQIVL